MTTKGCPVCHDPRLDQIALALLTDGPKKVAERFGLKLSEISYHRRHLPREIARQREALAQQTDEPATVLAASKSYCERQSALSATRGSNATGRGHGCATGGP